LSYHETTGLLFWIYKFEWGTYFLTCLLHAKNAAMALQVCYSFYPNFYYACSHNMSEGLPKQFLSEMMIYFYKKIQQFNINHN